MEHFLWRPESNMSLSENSEEQNQDPEETGADSEKNTGSSLPPIFLESGSTRHYTRIFFYSYLKIMRRLFSQDDRWALLFSSLLLVGLILFMGLMISGGPGDFITVWNDEGYERPTILYGKNEAGEDVPIAELYRFYRKVIELKDDSEKGAGSKIAKAFLATEDNNFYIHRGVDVQGILRAMVVNLLAGRVKEGASTITQQAARLRFLNRERSLFRKAREAFYALLMEMRYSKREILEIYLNEVPLGHGAIGAEAASRFYFGKSVFDLSWGEAAVLSSLTTRPYDFSPLRNPEESRQKVRVVLRKLVEYGEISVKEAQEEYTRLEDEYYTTLNRSPNDNAFNQRLNLHPYATEFIKYSLPRKIKRKIYTGGYRVYTTIRTDHQAAAEETFIPYLKEQTIRRKRPPFKHFDAFDDTYGDVYPLLRDLFGIPEFRFQISRARRDLLRAFDTDLRDETVLLSYLSGNQNIQSAMEHYIYNNRGIVEEELPVEGSLISMTPVTGEITAVVGGSGFTSDNQLLRFLTSRRQPGSSFKPIVYASGIEYTARHPNTEHPLTAGTLMDDSPVQFVGSDLTEYSPENYSGGYEGLITLRRGLYESRNAVAVRTYEYMGSSVINPIAEEILRFKRYSPDKKLPPEAAVALGSYAMTPYEMARAYGVFASDGKEIFPHVILRVENAKGEVVYENPVLKEKPEQVILPGTAEIITSMLGDVVNRGTGRAARIPGWPVSGKTGTTNRNTDAWFVGYTPDLITALHLGYDYTRSLGFGGTGGGIAAPVWGQYMRAIHENKKPQTFHFPGSRVSGVRICEKTGMLPGPYCENTTVEYFHPGTAPTSEYVTPARDALPPSMMENKTPAEDVFDAGDF